jgi:phosphate-selective porin OprO and OprP
LKLIETFIGGMKTMRKLSLAAMPLAALCFAVVEAKAEDTSKVYYKDGLRVEAGDFNLKTNIQLQPRYSFDSPDVGDEVSSFTLRRARLILSGDTLSKQVSFMLNNDFASDAGGSDIKDAWLQLNNEAANLRFGRTKVPMTRQQIISSGKLFFPDRSNFDDVFNQGRDTGLMAHGGLGANGHYYAGIFNGDTDGEKNLKRGVDNKHNGVLAVDFSSANYGSRGEEGDMRENKESGYTAGAAVLYGQGATSAFNALDAEEVILEDADQVQLNGDIGVRCSGSDLQAEVNYRKIELDDSSGDADQLGFYVQLAHNLDKDWGVGARFGLVDPDVVGLDDIQEYTLGLNRYLDGHRLKWQNQVTFEVYSGEGGGDEEDLRFVSQLSASL